MNEVDWNDFSAQNMVQMVVRCKDEHLCLRMVALDTQNHDTYDNNQQIQEKMDFARIACFYFVETWLFYWKTIPEMVKCPFFNLNASS